MPFPPAIDASIRKRFAELIAEGKGLHFAMHESSELERQRARMNGGYTSGERVALSTEYQAFRTKFLNLVMYVGGAPSFLEQIEAAREERPSNAANLLGVLQGLADDYANGFLDSVIRRAEAEVSADYLGQAQRLLEEGARVRTTTFQPQSS